MRSRTTLNRAILKRAMPIAVIVLSLLVIGCGGSAPAATEGHEAGRSLLVHLGGLATQRAQQQAPGVTLQQVDMAPGEGRYIFRFVDAGASRVIAVSGDSRAATPEAFTTAEDRLDTLLAPPASGIDLAVVRMGPDGVVASIVEALSAASPRSIILTRVDGRLVWRAVVNGPKGIVSGSVPDDTGRFLADAP